MNNLQWLYSHNEEFRSTCNNSAFIQAYESPINPRNVEAWLLAEHEGPDAPYAPAGRAGTRPCPSCGSIRILMGARGKGGVSWATEDEFHCYCYDCSSTYYPTEEEALDAWNGHRPEPCQKDGKNDVADALSSLADRLIDPTKWPTP